MLEEDYRAYLHWIIFVWPGLIFLGGLDLAYTEVVLKIPAFLQPYAGKLGVALILISFAKGLFNFLLYKSISVTVTQSGVVFCSGILVRNTIEIASRHIESIDVTQNLLGSLLDYGTLRVTGTGGSQFRLRHIAHPLSCRRAIESAKQTERRDL